MFAWGTFVEYVEAGTVENARKRRRVCLHAIFAPNSNPVTLHGRKVYNSSTTAEREARSRPLRRVRCLRLLGNRGAGDRFRTDDLVLGKHTLYQLSYTRPGTRMFNSLCARGQAPPARIARKMQILLRLAQRSLAAQFLDALRVHAQERLQHVIGIDAQKRRGTFHLAWRTGHLPWDAGVNPAPYFRMIQ